MFQIWGCQACRSVFVKFLLKFDLEFDLKFEISDGKNLVKFWGRTFRPARKARKISGRISGQISEQISAKISETSLQISRFFSEISFSRRAVLIQIASDLRFAIRITNRNRSQIARFGALTLIPDSRSSGGWTSISHSLKSGNLLK